MLIAYRNRTINELFIFGSYDSEYHGLQRPIVDTLVNNQICTVLSSHHNKWHSKSIFKILTQNGKVGYAWAGHFEHLTD